MSWSETSLRRATPATPCRRPSDAEDWFDDGLDFEENGDIDAAIEAYKQTVALDAQNVAAWINWGRLLHGRGNKREAEEIYRRAIEPCGPDPVLMFNLGVVLEDLGTHARGARGLSGGRR